MRTIPLLLLMLAAACAPQGIQAPPDIAIGTSAVEPSFVNPPSSILMCQQANILARLSNKGTSDISRGVYTFIVEDQILYAPKKSDTFTLEGKSKFNPQGGIQQLQLSVKNTGLPPQLESYSTPIILQTCYPYETFSTTNVCIDPDIQNMNPNKVCRPSTVSVGGQGAPVAVTRVEPIMEPIQDSVIPSFIISIANLGNGKVISSSDAQAACTTKQPLQGTVQVTADLQAEPLICTPETINLEAGREAKVKCTAQGYSGKELGTYQTLLSVTLNYGYVTNTIMPLNINKIPGQEECT